MLRWTLTLITTIQNKIWNIFITREMPFMPFFLQLPPPCQFLPSITVKLVLPILGSHISRILQYILFCACLPLLRIMAFEIQTLFHQHPKAVRMWVEPLAALYSCPTWLPSSCLTGIGRCTEADQGAASRFRLKPITVSESKQCLHGGPGTTGM